MLNFEAMAGGRPSKYTEELVDEFCRRIATSERSYAKICKEDDDMPSHNTINRWLNENESFREKYARAKQEQHDYMAEQILAIADDGTNDTIITEKGEVENREWVNRSRLRVDARKWLLSKLAPKKYGDKLDVTSDGEKVTGVTVIVQSPDTAKEQNDLRG